MKWLPITGFPKKKSSMENKLSWLNTVLWTVSGNSRDGACFELDKQTWRRKIFFASFRLFKRLPRTTKWMSESNTKELIVFGRNRVKSAYPSVYHINSLSRAATIAWSVRAIVIKRTVIIIILSCRLLSVSYQPLTGAKLRKRVSKLLHPRRENCLFFFRVRRKLPSVKHRPK